MPKSKWKEIIAAALATAAISGSGYFILQYKNSSIQVPAYVVSRVIDGDTFETTEKQLIRLEDVNAPELEYCGGIEAKRELEKLILNKPVYLKVLFRDTYQRLDSLVYTHEGLVNLHMVQKGLAQYRLSGQATNESKQMKLAGQKAKDQKLGVFSEKCTQTKNLNNSKCNIKGNVGETGNYYFFEGCNHYNTTELQLYLGDQWFCTREAAEKAGFTKAARCPN